MTAPRRTLIVGTYPPIPLPAAAATVAAVRRAWADGDEVTVVSPRVSAAQLAVPVAGILSGRRLANLRRHTGATRAVLVVEPGLPVPATTGGGFSARARQWATVRQLERAFRGFDHVTVVRAGSLYIPGLIEARLLRAANQVIDHAADGSRPPLGVTPLGPLEIPVRERPRRIATAVGRRLLGRYAGPLRARVRAAVGR
jgi:hypothetical protein